MLVLLDEYQSKVVLIKYYDTVVGSSGVVFLKVGV